MKQYQTPRCPQNATHGPLIPWASAIAGWYCPHQAHIGNPFYHTDLAPAARSGSDATPSGGSLIRQGSTKPPGSGPRPAAGSSLPAVGFGL